MRETRPDTPPCHHRAGGHPTGRVARAAGPALAVLLGVAGLSAAPSSARAEMKPGGDPDGILSVIIENDLFANGDRHYTNGIQFSYTPPETSVPDWVNGVADAVPLFNQGTKRRITYSLGQKMFTPREIEPRIPDPRDRPYAGYLYANAGLSSETATTLDRINLTVGVVGPASLADETQKFVHRLTDARTPRGWGSQLHNELGMVLSYNRAWRGLYVASPFGLAFDATPDLGVSVGNVYTFGSAGLTLRIGADLPQDYGPPRIAPPFQGTSYFEPDSRFGWYLFASAQGRAVARDIFLDGNTFRDSPSVDKKPLVGDLQLGFAVTVSDVRIAYTHIFRTKEFDGQDKADIYGSLSVSARF
ncbi:lipid A deacylase LpxR family protein [Azospirillum doebereinerae]